MTLGSLHTAARPLLLSALRIMTGLLLLEHGTAKYLGFPLTPNAGTATPATMSGAGGIFELACGVLLTFGILTRPAAFLLSGLSAVAYFWAHNPKGFFPILNGGELAISFCFTCLYLAAAGGGPLSVDSFLAGEPS